MEVLYILLSIFFISTAIFLIAGAKKNKILEIVSCALIFVSGCGLLLICFFCDKDNTDKKDEKTEIKEPTIKDYENGMASKDTVIWIHNGMSDTAEVLVWKK